jgi:NAD(P)-dependent dehydrogenase (short-subunit alcohol dehydrogenase family)
VASALGRFDLTGRVAVITGGGGLLGERHARAIASAGGIPVLADLNGEAAETKAHAVGGAASAVQADITSESEVEQLLQKTLTKHGRVDILVNNAANNPAVGATDAGVEWSRLANYPLDQWRADLEVGLTGAFLCSRVIGSELARRGSGVILNISSDLGVIAPDQRLYRREGAAEHEQPVKPASYSVVKTGLLGLTRYLATYWAQDGVRVNAISPGGVYVDQPDDFVQRLTALIPMGRMANQDEYEAAVLFLCSDASSYMTGQNLIVDGGRTAW